MHQLTKCFRLFGPLVKWDAGLRHGGWGNASGHDRLLIGAQHDQHLFGSLTSQRAPSFEGGGRTCRAVAAQGPSR